MNAIESTEAYKQLIAFEENEVRQVMDKQTLARYRALKEAYKAEFARLKADRPTYQIQQVN